MKNCSGINCPMQNGVVDAATCPSVDCCPYSTPPLTNYDRIISKTPEELAEWIYQVQDGDAYQKENFLPPLSKSWWLDWLKKEANNGNLH